ncbi:Glutamate receptor 2.7 [Morella rubra]|uniref:Glutamate receptor n=1 Tax=Morella rubra TaxID=262757 RepID=A0A6A1VGN6_9ROSI|nr:Glutamate receptor 2.7 [Morella rubra]
MAIRRFITGGGVSRPLFVFPLLIYSLFILLSYGAKASYQNEVTNVGAIVVITSRIGKEEKTAMEIAAQKFNDSSKSRKVSLNFLASNMDPSKVASAAEELIEVKKMDAIVGMHSWQEAALVANVGERARVPVLSFAAPAITSPFIQLRWPFLIRMANNASAEVKCIADIVRGCNWRRVIVIYEEDAYGGDSGMSTLFAEALQNFDAEIDYSLILPPLSSLSDSEGFLHRELLKLQKTTRCRVFVVLRSSLPMVTNLFRKAKNVGLVGGESAWIIPDSITSLLDSADKSVLSSMEGAIGIKTHYDSFSKSYKEFSDQFQDKFKANYPHEVISNPGVYALRAYDSISIITEAIERMTGDKNSTQLLGNILSSHWSGLSGDLRFEGRELTQAPLFKIMYVAGNRSSEIDIWTPEHEEDRNSNETWPHLTRVPGGWEMPTPSKPLRIIVPGNHPFEQFVKVDSSNKPSGFCIDIFYGVLNNSLNNRDDLRRLHYEFVPSNGTFDELIALVSNKIYDGIVGDLTIQSNRSKLVDFTQPYIESSLVMIVPAKPDPSAWLFMKPFSGTLWLLTLVSLLYTMFMVWFLEHKSNDEFKGSFKEQISTILWFAFCSLFFANREKINSNLTRVVVVVWFFLVFVLTSSYTANLSSMLTIQRQDNGVTINSLKKENLKVGYLKGNFFRKYLVEGLRFTSTNIKPLNREVEFKREFESKDGIDVALLELPYAKVFLQKYCKGYTSIPANYRFGGFGFAFQKGSPLAREFSEAILRISENGVLYELENKWLNPSNGCPDPNVANSDYTEGLGPKRFWVLFAIFFSTSTGCFLLSLFRLSLKNFPRSQVANQVNATQRNHSSTGPKVAGVALAASFYGKLRGRARFHPEGGSSSSSYISTDHRVN